MPTLDLDGVSIYFEERGEGPPVLLIMGLGTPGVGWRYQVPQFSARYRTITFDNRGCGRSSAPPGPYSIAQLADDALALLSALGIERAHVVGVSMGGMIAQEIAIEHPERVGALVLASTFAAPGASEKEAFEKGRGLAALFPKPGSNSVDPFAALRFIVDLAFSPEFIEREGATLLGLFMESCPDGISAQGQFAQAAAVMAHDSRARLGRVRAPTLAITGDTDRLVPCAHSDEIVRLVPGARLARLAGGSHAVNFERPEEWNAVVLSFLAEHDVLLETAAPRAPEPAAS